MCFFREEWVGKKKYQGPCIRGGFHCKVRVCFQTVRGLCYMLNIFKQPPVYVICYVLLYIIFWAVHVSLHSRFENISKLRDVLVRDVLCCGFDYLTRLFSTLTTMWDLLHFVPLWRSSIIVNASSMIYSTYINENKYLITYVHLYICHHTNCSVGPHGWRGDISYRCTHVVYSEIILLRTGGILDHSSHY